MRKREMLKQVIIAIMLVLPSYSFAQQAQLHVDVTQIASNAGSIAIGLYDAQEQKVDSLRIDAAKGNVQAAFDSLIPGKYTIRMYHDANGNHEMDENFMGIPKEGYGFSTNPDAKYGPPAHEKLLVEVKETTEIVVEMRYYW